MKTSIALIAAAGIAVAATAGTSPVINELQPNQPGFDPSTQSLELRGAAGTMFSGVFYSLDTDFSPGQTIDRLEVISGTFDSNGLLVVNIADLENPSATYILGAGGSAALGDAFMGDYSIFGTIYDAVNSPDNGTDGANSLAGGAGGTDLGFIGSEPLLIQRDSISGEWLQINFAGDVYDAAGNLLGNSADFDPSFDVNVGTFGGANLTVVPAPAALAVLGFGGIAAARRRR
jgi:hypothetical protein